jgi:hypothetical protein
MAKVKVLKVLKVLNVQGTSEMGFFAAENRLPAIRRYYQTGRFFGLNADSCNSRGMIALHRTSNAIEVGESNAG